ncbi:MAG: leucyl aminopeptidase [Chloroflexi bacterium]|nr:leucyl aminopeptidase [Chloroflexota bacterium]MCI0580201.1 leucyl aminopeptidase [Chloroflexota bacterium]MCI0646031.1 leucyl aminopeptidase [Chloroflexota bacterium]MCI0727373.1 leucyl aminopeptidase [Chloroflexota bacterium]
MKVDVAQGSIEKSTADTIVVSLFEGVTSPGGATGAVDRALNGAISDLIAGGDLKGKAGEVAVFYPRGAIPARRVLVVGLGKQDKFDLEAVRKAAATAIKRARALNAKHVATVVHGAGAGGLPVAAAAQATVEGSLLASYRFQATRHKEEENEVESLTVVEFDQERLAAAEVGVETAEAVVAGVALARDLVNMPPNVATPTKLAEVAGQIASDHNMLLTVGDREWAAGRKMGAFLAVAKGAGEPPKFIVLEHNGGRSDLETIVLVGKGITFDTGGISIKPSERMGAMKSDLGGAAAVLGAMKVVGLLNLPLRIIGIAPATENMPDANAYRPADVITASNGKTIEIISTDAEGRMVLADALVYAGQYQPKAVVDLATLTGACVVALGAVAAGVFSSDDNLRDKLVAAGTTTHERLWPLPLWPDYREMINSDVADMKNSGGRNNGVATSAVFLQEFTDYPWAHLDIAGMALSEKDEPYIPAGGTGFGVRLLIEFLRNW